MKNPEDEGYEGDESYYPEDEKEGAEEGGYGYIRGEEEEEQSADEEEEALSEGEEGTPGEPEGPPSVVAAAPGDEDKRKAEETLRELFGAELSELRPEALAYNVEEFEKQAGTHGAAAYGVTQQVYDTRYKTVSDVLEILGSDERQRLGGFPLKLGHGQVIVLKQKHKITLPSGEVKEIDLKTIADPKAVLQLSCAKAVELLKERKEPQTKIDELEKDCKFLLDSSTQLLTELLYRHVGEAVEEEATYAQQWWDMMESAGRPTWVFERLKQKMGYYAVDAKGKPDAKRRLEARRELARTMVAANIDAMKPAKVKLKATRCQTSLRTLTEYVKNPDFIGKVDRQGWGVGEGWVGFLNEISMPAGVLIRLVKKYEPFESHAKQKAYETLLKMLTIGKLSLRPKKTLGANPEPWSWFEAAHPRRYPPYSEEPHASFSQVEELMRMPVEEAPKWLERFVYEVAFPPSPPEQKQKQYAPAFMVNQGDPNTLIIPLTDEQGKPRPEYNALIELIPQIGNEKVRVTECARERSNPPHWYIDYSIWASTQNEIAKGGGRGVSEREPPTPESIREKARKKLLTRSKPYQEIYKQWNRRFMREISKFNDLKLKDAMNEVARNAAERNIMPYDEVIRLLNNVVKTEAEGLTFAHLNFTTKEQELIDDFWNVYDKSYTKWHLDKFIKENDLLPHREKKVLLTTKIDDTTTLTCEDKLINAMPKTPDYPLDVGKIVVHHICTPSSDMPKATASKMKISPRIARRAYELLRDEDVLGKGNAILKFDPDRNVKEAIEPVEHAEVFRKLYDWEIKEWLREGRITPKEAEKNEKRWVPVHSYMDWGKIISGTPAKVTPDYLWWKPRGRPDPTPTDMDRFIIDTQEMEVEDPKNPSQKIKVKYEIYDVLHKPPTPEFLDAMDKINREIKAKGMLMLSKQATRRDSRITRRAKLVSEQDPAELKKDREEIDQLLAKREKILKRQFLGAEMITGRVHIEDRLVLHRPKEAQLVGGYGPKGARLESISRIAKRMVQSRMELDRKTRTFTISGPPIHVPSDILSPTQIEHIPTEKTLNQICGIPKPFLDTMEAGEAAIEQCRQKVIQATPDQLNGMVQRLRLALENVRVKMDKEERDRLARLGKVYGVEIEIRKPRGPPGTPGVEEPTSGAEILDYLKKRLEKQREKLEGKLEEPEKKEPEKKEPEKKKEEPEKKP